jgi:hypothetical protein
LFTFFFSTVWLGWIDYTVASFLFIFPVVSLSLKHILDFQKISSLAENTSSQIVFNEVLAAAGRDIVTKDISRLRGGWSMQDAFYVSSI